jgi:hypothetical protein
MRPPVANPRSEARYAPTMTTTISCARLINAPQQRVFHIFTDLRRAAERVKAINSLEVLTDGPIARGTRFRETRTMFGRSATETMEITAFDAPNSYSVGCDSCGARYTTVFTFKPQGQSTRVEMSFSIEARSFMARLFKPLGRLMMGQLRKCLDADLNDLQRAAEASDPGAEPGR